MEQASRELRWERNFREQMRRRREAAKESQSAFAKRIAATGLPFHQPTVQRIEDGERPVRLDEAHVIAEALGTTVGAMVASSSDTRVDASIAVDHFIRYAEDVHDTTFNSHIATEDQWGQLVETLNEALDRSGPIPSPVACWLGAWVAKGLELRSALEQVVDVAGSFDTDWDESYALAGAHPDVFTDIARTRIEDDELWATVPERLQPRILAELSPYELYYGFLNNTGPFGPQLPSVITEYISSYRAYLDGVDQEAP